MFTASRGRPRSRTLASRPCMVSCTTARTPPRPVAARLRARRLARAAATQRWWGGTRWPGPLAQRSRAGGPSAAGRRQPNQAIARELVVTVDTVKSHVTHLLGKLGAANCTQAVTWAQ